MPFAGATLVTYERWFAGPQGLHRPGPLLQQPLSAGCMRTFLRFKMGAVFQTSRVDATAVLGLCATARNVTCTVLGRGVTCFWRALPCSVHETDMLP